LAWPDEEHGRRTPEAAPASIQNDAVSKAITDKSYAAMRGEKSAEDAIKDMQAAIEAASK